MRRLSKILLFIFVVVIAFSPTAIADCKRKAPSKSDFEVMFGKAVSCNRRWSVCRDQSGKEIECPEPEGYVCFKNTSKIKIKVEFNSSNYAKRILIDDPSNSWEAFRAAEQIVMINGRGKFLKRVQKVPPPDAGCLHNFIEEYEDLSMEYYSIICQGSSPGGVIINWKE